MTTRPLAAAALAAALALSLGLQAAADTPVGLSILTPSAGNDTIAPGRDFYVTGAITGTVPEGSRLSVALFSDKQDEPLRMVYTDIKDNREGLLIGDDLEIEDRSLLAGSGMPDLVYDPADPNSFFDVWRKCYYDDSSFSALISGGRYRTGGMRLIDEEGNPYPPLGAGGYTLEVTIESQGNILAKVTKRVTLGVTPNKVLTSVTPESHLDRVLSEARLRHYSYYTDLFPGRWKLNMPNGEPEDDVSFEISGKWKQAFRAEYAQGLSHLYLYNLTETDPIHTVALGLLQQQGVVDDPTRLLCYYYDIGEPTLPYLPHRGSRLLSFSPKEKLVFTRAESSTLPAGDNRYDPQAPFHGMVDFVVGDGIDVQPGETLSLFGATAPIQNRGYELREQDDHSVAIGNRISTVRYTIEGDGVSLQLEKPVELTRSLGETESTSIYEFRHTFSIGEDWTGKILRVKVQGVDAYGRNVEEAVSRFELRVAAVLVTGEEQSPEGAREAVPTDEPPAEPGALLLNQDGALLDV